MKKNFERFALSVVLLALPVVAFALPTPVEIIQTVPEETTLARVRAIPNLSFAFYDIKPITGGINHSKHWIFDGRKIFVGSQNFDWRSLEQIHETGVLVESKAIAHRLRKIFEHDWTFATTGRWKNSAVSPFSISPSDVELVASPERLNPKRIPTALTRLLSLISNAKKSLRISLLDYSTTSDSEGRKPWLELDDTLRAAAARGVKVQLLVSHWNTTKGEIGSIKALSGIPNLEVRISFIPEHSAGHIPYARVLHSKTIVVDDDIYWVGTSNWSRGYFYDTRDIEVILRRPDVAAIGTRIFEAIWSAPHTEPLDPNREYPEPRKE